MTKASNGETYYGKDCPEGMVQIEFVGCHPAERVNDYTWKPCKHAFVEIYVDGRRFRIDVGDFANPREEKGRRGLHIVGPIGMGVDQHSLNACDLTITDDGEGRTLKAMPPSLIQDQKRVIEAQAHRIETAYVLLRKGYDSEALEELREARNAKA